MAKKDIEGLFGQLNKSLKKLYFGKYGAGVRRQKQEIDDFFMILAFSEIMGIENPFAFYTLEILTDLMPNFHQWHKKMGMQRSCFDSFPCACCC